MYIVGASWIWDKHRSVWMHVFDVMQRSQSLPCFRMEFEDMAPPEMQRLVVSAFKVEGVLLRSRERLIGLVGNVPGSHSRMRSIEFMLDRFILTIRRLLNQPETRSSSSVAYPQVWTSRCIVSHYPWNVLRTLIWTDRVFPGHLLLLRGYSSIIRKLREVKLSGRFFSGKSVSPERCDFGPYILSFPDRPSKLIWRYRRKAYTSPAA
ncbi:hypothetical protein SCLCIDRAFT_775358 [Scleroderma citrinum Foug A]|uniref:Uncharacterized protein n=1 Tax=Scleroderma citrinum Foug A TaxID=1036808 RepID=A0A0C3D3J4_9AGAM|nr:hypothetical protein SCLCIDRAFT_775358 [Scleroderma citrinum Foug A]